MKRFLFVSACLLCIKLMGQSVPAHVPTNGLVGWWPFDGNANDLSGNGNNGTSNGPTSTANRKGEVGKAYQFDGVNDYITVANSPTITIQGNITFSFWMYMSGGGCNPRVLEINSILDNCGGYAFAMNGTSNISRTIHTATFGSCTNTISIWNSSTPINSLSWQHVAVSMNGSLGTGKIYVNGQLYASLTGSVVPVFSYNGNHLTFGNVNPNRCDWWGGKLDDFGLWNRALSASEIEKLYTECAGSLTESPSNSSSAVGSTATFTALSSASGATYQWQVKSGATVTNVSNSGQFSGATSSTLSVSNISSANNGMEFRCIVDHGLCLDTTDFATLSICSGAIQPTVDTVPSALTFSSVQSTSAPAAVPSGEIWKINQITYQSIPAQATNNTGTQTVVDKIQINCQEITVRKTSTSSNNSGASNALSWETKLPIWLPPGTLIEPGTGVEAINIIRFSSNPL